MLLFLAVQPRTAAAEQMQKRWSFWLLGGFSFTNNASQGLGGVNGVTGLSFGIGGEVKVLPQISLCLDILDVQKGFQNTFGGALTNYDLQYLEFPFTIKYSPAAQVAFRLGPYLGAFLTSAIREGQGISASVKGNFKNDFGVTVGTWFGFNPNPSMSVGLDLRYDMGLSNILNDAAPENIVKTRAAIAMATVAFYFK